MYTSPILLISLVCFLSVAKVFRCLHLSYIGWCLYAEEGRQYKMRPVIGWEGREAGTEVWEERQKQERRAGARREAGRTWQQMLRFFSGHRYRLLWLFLKEEYVQDFVLSRWANYILAIRSETIVWCVLSCGNLIEFKKACASRTHWAYCGIRMYMPGMVNTHQVNC